VGAIDGGTIRPASGSYTAGKPSRPVSGGCATGETIPANPALGFAGLLSGVSGAFSQHAAALLRRARVLRGPQFAAALFPWAAIRSWVCARLKSGDVHSFDFPLDPRAQGVPGTARPFENRISEATSLPSPALQRLRAICA